jgi:hypothetical protein
MFSQMDNRNLTGSDKAMAFVNSLNEAQQKIAVFPFGEMNRYEWHYLPASTVVRSGIAVKDLNAGQKQKLDELMQVYLSKEGLQKTKDIMDFEYLLKEMEPNNSSRIPENYFISVYGQPGKDSIWAWKFTGHHVTLNFTIVNDQLAFAPFFFGIYPAEVKDGPKKGKRILKEEEELGFELVNSLSAEQKQKAIFQLKTFADIVTTNSKHVELLKPAGIFGSELSHDQKAVLNKLIVAYLLAMPTDIAKIRIEKIVKEDMNTICFGWAGGTKAGIPHYYRVQGKTFLIEFDNTQNNANHIHSVWRDFDGDFGRDLIQEHYQSSDHHH